MQKCNSAADGLTHVEGRTYADGLMHVEGRTYADGLTVRVIP
ncbi:hypothetical protein COLU111180_10700 [Cohnella lubricantis]|nr:hypothetical protein [Cohnella lubricantis]MBP2118452.1 hypothetical protein [Cohnella lubricantis]